MKKEKTVPVLFSKRLSLREITERDTDFIVSLRSNPDVYRFFIFPHQVTKEEHIKWYFDSYLYNENRLDWIAFSETGKAVGIFGVKRENKSASDAEVSYILSPDDYGKGYASEAIERLIDFCKSEWKCNIVSAEIHQDNMKSIRFAEQLRFKKISQNGNFFRFERQID